MSRGSIESKHLCKIVAAFPSITITVLGDMVADEFVMGEISRVSREAPVLILRHRECEVVPGGGANAVNNLADLGVKVRPVGVVGHDDRGGLLLGSFRRKRIPTAAVFREKNRPTVTKTRILAGMPHTWRQQVVRIDREPETCPDRRIERDLVRAARQYLGVSDALLVSDYGYGAATPALLAAVRQGVSRTLPVVVDSRHRLLCFAGATAATPNEAEVEEALGIHIGQDWQRLCAAGSEIMSRMKLQSLVITRGRDGMAAFERRRRGPVDIPIFGSDEVTDVTGAGDTVIATFTAALAAGASAEEAAHLANYAGGIVVMKRGTATVSREELLTALDEAPPRTRSH
jgi:D-glycero-beta-D-manno-heptose-7-phosphate kinase